MGPVADAQTGMPSAGDGAKTHSQPLENMVDTHESSLLSHLHLVKSLANTAESDANRMVGQVLDSAQKLVENFSLLREQLNKQKLDSKTDNTNNKRKMHAAPKSQRAFTPKMDKDSSSDSLQNDIRSGQKRCRTEEHEADAESSGQKRTRTKRAIAGANDDVSDYVPVALQKDDISEQVERRLRLREEQRRVKHEQPGMKRKRDSSSSQRTKPDSPAAAATKPERAIRKRYKHT